MTQKALFAKGKHGLGPSAAAAMLSQTGVIIPTHNAGPYWPDLSKALAEQGIEPDQVLIVDSHSCDDTRTLAVRAGFRIVHVADGEFRHGATRQMAADLMPWAKILVYLTQDAIPQGKHAIRELIAAFDDPSVGAAFGRQLPRAAAGPIERHARLFSYPDIPAVRTFECRKTLGFKAVFFSNSFAAYRRTALEEVGGFPKGAIVSEEMTVAAHMLVANWKTVYQPSAMAIHSHALTLRQESSRYFDIGVHHGRDPWLLHEFGGAGGEGRAFVMSQMRYLLENGVSLIPYALLRNVSKFCSYQLGRREKYLPHGFKKLMSGQPSFWSRDVSRGGENVNSSQKPPMYLNG